VTEASQFAAIVLAAGASSRMGRTKALLQYQGETFLSCGVRLFQPFCGPVIVVLPPSGLECPAGVLCTVNPAPERGMLTSLQTGLKALPDSARFVFFTPVDLPAIAPQTVSALRRAVGQAPAIIPRHFGRRGHPVLISRELVRDFLELRAPATARDVMERHSGQVRYIDVDDPGVVTDIDEPADYARLTGASR
jgi:CTP:molybdopterin cytidylyltransferase MocA